MSQVTQWTQQMDEQLKKLFYAAKKYQDIADMMGLPKTVVQRRLHKLQLFRGTTTVSNVIREPWQPGTPKPDFKEGEPYSHEPSRPRRTMFARGL